MRISIQVCLDGYSFELNTADGSFRSGWLGADKFFTTREFQRRYDEVEISLFTPKFTLVPEHFFCEEARKDILAEVCPVGESDQVQYVSVSGNVMVYSATIGETLSKMLAQTVLMSDGTQAQVLPEAYYMLKYLQNIADYNKIVVSRADGYVYIVISQGSSLQLCNVFQAGDFTTALYFLFAAVRKLQINPELSSVYFRTPLTGEEQELLYRYFRSVENI